MGWVTETGGGGRQVPWGGLAGGCHHPGLKAWEKASRTWRELVLEEEPPPGRVALGGGTSTAQPPTSPEGAGSATHFDVSLLSPGSLFWGLPVGVTQGSWRAKVGAQSGQPRRSGGWGGVKGRALSRGGDGDWPLRCHYPGPGTSVSKGCWEPEGSLGCACSRPTE